MARRERKEAVRPVIILDNGGDTCKVGLAGQATPRIIPNYAVKPKREQRLYIATDIDELTDFSQLYFKRPIEKGYVVNWDLEFQIWSKIFGKKGIDTQTKDAVLLVTEPLFNPNPIRKTMDEVVFEKFGFEGYVRLPPPALAVRGYQVEHPSFAPVCALVVDSGYSFTHIVPVIEYSPVYPAIRRINIGGKVLTNYLKETISYRAWNMMDETHLINTIKHRLCYVALDFEAELRASRIPSESPLRKEFVLPNGTTRLVGYVKGEYDDPAVQKSSSSSSSSSDDKTGVSSSSGSSSAAAATVKTESPQGSSDGETKVKPEPMETTEDEQSEQERQKKRQRKDEEEDEEQVLVMNNERIAIPELLFNPSDIGVQQAGIPEAIVQAVNAVPEQYRAMLYENILLVGGNALFRNFKERIERELRPLVPEEYNIRIHVPASPLTTVWQGGNAVACTPGALQSMCVRKSEYQEHGARVCAARFRNTETY